MPTSWLAFVFAATDLMASGTISTARDVSFGCHISRPGIRDRVAAWQAGFVSGSITMCLNVNGRATIIYSGLDRTTASKRWATNGPDVLILGGQACQVDPVKHGSFTLSGCAEAGLWEPVCLPTHLLGTCATGRVDIEDSASSDTRGNRIFDYILGSRDRSLTAIPRLCVRDPPPYDLYVPYRRSSMGVWCSR